MKKFFTHPKFLLVLRLCVAAVFIYAGGTKIGNPQVLADSIFTFRLLPLPIINLLALTLPPLEIILGLLILGNWNRRPALFGLALIIAIFLAALGQAHFRGIEVSCGCFGSGDTSSSAVSLLRDLILFAIVCYLYYRENDLRYFPETP